MMYDVTLSIRPDATIQAKNRLLLESTFLQSRCPQADDDEFLEGPPMSSERRAGSAEFLISVDNDSWQSDQIIHWCRLGCCRSVKESKLKLWVALQVWCFRWNVE